MKTKKTLSKMRTADFKFAIKSISEDGKFAGYGSVFDVIDQGDDVVIKGAFTETLKELEASGQKLPVLWQHKSDSPIGVYDVIREDEKGLYVEGRLLVNDVQLAKEAYALMAAGAVTGLSIGYGTQRYEIDTETNIRKLIELSLWEISVVTFPMNEDARVESVKNLIHNGGLPETVTDFEKFLRNEGFSSKNAKIIARQGIKGLIHRNGEEKSEMAELGSILSDFKVKL